MTTISYTIRKIAQINIFHQLKLHEIFQEKCLTNFVLYFRSYQLIYYLIKKVK